MRVLGPTVDHETRCIHYSGPTDVVALKFFCCREYYPCHRCHDESAAHPSSPWPVGSLGETAVLCGVCRSELTIGEYYGVSGCPTCGSAFNPGCALHRHLYFSD